MGIMHKIAQDNQEEINNVLTEKSFREIQLDAAKLLKLDSQSLEWRVYPDTTENTIYNAGSHLNWLLGIWKRLRRKIKNQNGY